MATISLSTIITDIRGRLNGTSFQGGVRRLTVRNKRKRKDSISISERTNLNLLSQLSDNWQRLTLTQKQTWYLWGQWSKQVSKHNHEQFITAYNSFIRVNLPRLKNNIAIFSTPPLSNDTPTVSTFSCSVGASNTLFLNSSVILSANEIIIVKISQAKETGSYIGRNECKAITTLITNNNQWNITTDYNKLYGSAVFSGLQIGCITQQINLLSGQRFPAVFSISSL